jgi:3',5'-cyclic AMP phosphodiesterase CpdA
MSWIMYRDNFAASHGQWQFLFLDFAPKPEDLKEIKSEGAHEHQWSEMYRGREVVEVDDGDVPLAEVRKRLEAAEASLAFETSIRAQMIRQLLDRQLAELSTVEQPQGFPP